MSKEKQILHHIRMNPFISQQELAKKVGLSRPAVANYIAKLTRLGEIKGRAYILKEESSIMCIGGANTDRKAKSNHKVRLHSSNSVKVTEVCGGVARNVAENLSRLGHSAGLLTCVGNDREGQWILEETKHHGVDVSLVWTLESRRTGTYTALIDVTGDMVVSMADMDLYEQITIEMIEEKWSHIAAAEAVFLDTNFPKDAIHFVIERCREENIPLYVNPVSHEKAQKLPYNLEGVELLILDQEEIQPLADEEIKSEEQLRTASKKMLERGVRHVIILLHDHGVYYESKDESGYLPPYPNKVADETGADDAFTACVMHGLLNGESFAAACRLGLAGYSLTQQTERSVSTEMRQDKIETLAKEHDYNQKEK